MSLHGHSSANAAQQYILFSLDDQSPAAMAHFRHWCAANGIERKTVLGRYNGKAEYSELVKLGDWFTNICATPLVANQESVLLLGPMNARDRRSACLIYMDNRADYVENLGTMGEVSREEALASDAYTFDPSGGVDRWFICKKVWPAGTMHKGEPIETDHMSEREFAKFAKAHKPVHKGESLPFYGNSPGREALGLPPAKLYKPVHGGYPDNYMGEL